jgi:hypothetical protein
MMRVQIYGPNGPYSGFSIEKNRKRFSLPSGSILNGSPRDKFVAWNGVSYELHHSAERILCDDTLLLIGQVKEIDASSPEVKERERRAKLLVDFKGATNNPSNRQIYSAQNSGIHKPEFYKWCNGTLPANSATTINFERFLNAKKPPRKW